MNLVSIGTSPLDLPEGGFLYLNDEVPQIPRARYFDYRKHSINLLNLNELSELDRYRKICDIVDAFDALFVVTGGTLTESTGLEYLAERLDQAGDITAMVDLIPKPDSKSPSGHHWAHGKVQRLMRSPVLRKMLTGKPNFVLDPTKRTFARLNRAELGDFDARAIAYFLIALFPGTVIIPDFGFYGRDLHTALIRENRITAGVRSLKRIERNCPDLHDELLLIENKVIKGALYPDAVTLADYDETASGARLKEDTIGYDDFIRDAMEPPEPREPVPLWVPPPLTEVPKVEKKPRRRSFKRATDTDWH